MINRKYAYAAILHSLIIIFLSSLHDKTLSADVVPGNSIIMNLAHIPIYSIFAILWLKWLEPAGRKKDSLLMKWIILAGFILFAVLDEIHQSFVPGRTASLMDLGLDFVGILLGIGIIMLMRSFSFSEKKCSL